MTSTPELTTILLLEDLALVRGGMKALIQLAQPRAEVHEAASYEQAMALLASRRFDVAFLDFDLRTEHTGLDVLKHLRASECGTFAIMISGIDDRNTVLECLDAGACGYIPKDIDPASLDMLRVEDIFKRALETVFQGGIYLPASVLGRGGFSPTPPMPKAIQTAEALGLSKRLCEVLYYLCQGLSNKAIARKMDIAEGTVRKDYVTAIFRFFGVQRRTELIIEISRRGISVKAPAVPEGTAEHARFSDPSGSQAQPAAR